MKNRFTLLRSQAWAQRLGLLALMTVPFMLYAYSCEQKVTPDDPAGSDRFGKSVGMDNDLAIVGAHTKVGSGMSSGAAYIFYLDYSDTTWRQEAKLAPSNGQNGDQFGFATSVSTDGNVAIIGAPYKKTNGFASGSAYVFKRNADSTWTQVTELTAPSPKAGDFFGYSVFASHNRLIVGALGIDDAGPQAGAAYIYDWDGSAATFATKLTASDATANSYFGMSVSIDDSQAVVGAPLESSIAEKSGAAYVFMRNGSGVWNQAAKLKASDAAYKDSLGISVGIHDTVVIAGAYGKDVGFNNTGAAYIFADSAGTWKEIQMLTSIGAEENDFFGFSVDITHDYAVVGLYGADSQTGRAEVFTPSLDVWTFDHLFPNAIAGIPIPSDPPFDLQPGDKIGYSVAISAEWALAGAPGDDDEGGSAGAAYFNENNPSVSGIPGGGGLSLVKNKPTSLSDKVNSEIVPSHSDANAAEKTESGRIELPAKQEQLQADLYPNPSTGIVNLNLKMEQETQAVMTVMTVTGQIVDRYNQVPLSENTTQVLDLTGMANGLYLVVVESSTQKIVKRVVISR